MSHHVGLPPGTLRGSIRAAMPDTQRARGRW
jgi:hypothetical protein